MSLPGTLRRLLGLQEAPQRAAGTKHLWSIGIFAGPTLVELAPDPLISNPVLTRADVTDIPAMIVADPFLVHTASTWHMFFEALNRTTGRGEIALATSDDLTKWTYRQVVLREPFHLSYPSVFQWMGAYYMVPETNQTRTIRLYRADEFPLRWTLVHTLLSGRRFSDTTLFRHGDRWWLFTETSDGTKHDTLRLYSADDLLGAWTEHPSSPIVEGDARSARPAGPVVENGGQLMRFAQDCVPRYGLAVNGFEITELSVDKYSERPLGSKPLLTATGIGWNSAGMHHLDAHRVAPGRWITAVDGWMAVTAAELAGEA